MSVAKFEKMRVDEMTKRSRVTPWTKPGQNVTVMPSGLMGAAALSPVPVQRNQMMAAMFASQMAASAEVAVCWALEQARSFQDKTIPEFGLLVGFAQKKAAQQGLFDSLGRQIAENYGEAGIDFSAKRRALAAQVLKHDPLAVQLFVLETNWGSEWTSEMCRSGENLTHPALPLLMAAERRVDAELRGFLKVLVGLTSDGYGPSAKARAARDLLMIYRLAASMAARCAASFSSLMEITSAAEILAADRSVMFAQFDDLAATIAARPISRLASLEQFVSEIDGGLVFLSSADDFDAASGQPPIVLAATA